MWPFKRKKVLFTIEVVKDRDARVSYARYHHGSSGTPKHLVGLGKDVDESGELAALLHEIGHVLGHTYLTEKHALFNEWYPATMFHITYGMEEEAWDHARKMFEASRETALSTYRKAWLNKISQILTYTLHG